MNYTNPISNPNGPSSDIALAPEHGGPILCMDANKDIVVTGSTDHGLRVYSLLTGKQQKELYNKNYGHTEWVTCVTILPDSRIVSGGMDSKICIWEPVGVKCKYIMDHTGSISNIKCDENGVLLSSSYDSSIRIYDLNSSTNSLSTLSGVHKGAVTDFEWKNSLCVSAGRDGIIGIWDINQEVCINSHKVHNGQMNRIKFHSDECDTNLIITAGMNDGVLSAIDMRSNTKVFSKRIHSGSINFMDSNKSNLIITGSVDKTIKILDITKNFEELGKMKATDSIFCGDLYESTLVVGCGDGNILAYNLNTMDCLYGYGVDNKGVVKNVKIIADKKKIITSGESGQGMILIF